MEKEILKEKKLSARELIESARQCVGRGHCIACDFADDEYCDEAMKLALADKLEELLVLQKYEEGKRRLRTATPHQSPAATASPQGEAFQEEKIGRDVVDENATRNSEEAYEDDYRLTARENGHAYFIGCFEEPCAGGGCKYDNCAFIRAVCEKLCRYEESAGARGVEWIPCEVALPAEADEYLVMIVGHTKPTTLWYDPDEEAFYEEGFDGETIWYPVTHWAELPEGPEMPREKPRPTVKRCATCRHEDRLGDEERCLDCEKHSLWEQR